MGSDLKAPANFNRIQEIIAKTKKRERGFNRSLSLADWHIIPETTRRSLHQDLENLDPDKFQTHLNESNLGIIEESGDFIIHLIIHKALEEGLISEDTISSLRKTIKAERKKLSLQLAQRIIELINQNIEENFSPDDKTARAFTAIIPGIGKSSTDQVKELIKTLLFRAALINSSAKNNAWKLRTNKIPEEFIEYIETLGDQATEVETALIKLLNLSKAEEAQFKVLTNDDKKTRNQKRRRLAKAIVDNGLHSEAMKVVIGESKAALGTNAKKSQFTMKNILDFAAKKIRSYRSHRIFTDAMGLKKTETKKASKAWEAIWEAARFFDNAI